MLLACDARLVIVDVLLDILFVAIIHLVVLEVELFVEAHNELRLDLENLVYRGVADRACFDCLDVEVVVTRLAIVKGLHSARSCAVA